MPTKATQARPSAATAAPAWAVLRVRGPVKVQYVQEDTLRMLRLHRVNHLAVVPATDTYRGMVKKVEHLVTYGEIDATTLSELLAKRGAVEGGAALTDAHVAEHSSFGSIAGFAAAVVEGRATLKDVEGLKPVFRLSPPRGGLETTGKKRHFNEGGSLGYRRSEINGLVTRML